MPSSVLLLLVGLLAPGLSLPFPSGLQDIAYKKDGSVAPEVRLLQSSRKPQDNDYTVMLRCRPSTWRINSEDVYITRLENDEPEPLSPNTELRWKDANGQNNSNTSELLLVFNEFLVQASFSCQVTHKPTSTNMKSQARKRTAYNKDESVAPEVRLLHSSRKPQNNNDTIMLTCSISSKHSDGVNITWLENGKPNPLSPNIERHWKDVNMSTTSTLYLPLIKWRGLNSFSCQVTHKPTSTNMESQARKRRGESNPDVKVYTQRPNPEDLNLEKSAKFACVMSKEKLAASWLQANPGTLTNKTLEVRTKSNGTTTTINQATASITDGKGGETFTCKVGHAQELAGPEGEKTG